MAQVIHSKTGENAPEEKAQEIIRRVTCPKPWVFTEADETTGEIYDQTQCDEAISDGDVLVCCAERVVGIMMQAWPTAITSQTGHFHSVRVAPGESVDAVWAGLGDVCGGPGAKVDYTASLILARHFAAAIGAPLQEGGAV